MCGAPIGKTIQPTLAAIVCKAKIKIIVATHKKYKMPEEEIYLPIQVGAEEKDGLGYQKDNEGENISLKNPYYCELTALYWAWKNYDKLGNPDYIGLMHYRRHLIMRAGELDVVHFEELDEENYLKECCRIRLYIAYTITNYKGKEVFKFENKKEN